VQLRPETVLFIDDSPLNLAEATAFVPGIQVADGTVIPTLLHGLKGMADPDLTRLKQYKLLENRCAELRASGLIHYCFSCRTLGMGVETWLYRWLGRPPIHVTGEVVVDLHRDAQIDWIRLDDGLTVCHQQATERQRPIRMRGACEMLAIRHYPNLASDEVTGEFAYSRDGVQVRIEHSLALRYAAHGVSDDLARALHSNHGDRDNVISQISPHRSRPLRRDSVAAPPRDLQRVRELLLSLSRMFGRDWHPGIVRGAET
jgi:hypothetical protein